MHPSIILVNAVQKNKEHPDTFHIPSAEDIANIRPGDNVKLIFKTEDAAERMWVHVTGQGVGTVNNDPMFLPIECGDVVEFENHHIIDIYPRDDSHLEPIQNNVIGVCESCNMTGVLN